MRTNDDIEEKKREQKIRTPVRKKKYNKTKREEEEEEEEEETNERIKHSNFWVLLRCVKNQCHFFLMFTKLRS